MDKDVVKELRLKELRIAAQSYRIIAAVLWEGGSDRYIIYDELAAEQEQQARELEKENAEVHI